MLSETAKYFRPKPGNLVRVQSTRFGRVDFRTLTFSQAEKLYKSGFDHIELTDEGRVKYLGEPAKEITAREACEKINKAETLEEAEAILNLKPESKSVQAAFERRKQFFHD